MKNATQSILLLCAMAILTQCAQQATEGAKSNEPTFDIANQHLLVWNEAINQVMALADSMPEEMYGYKPHDSIRSFAEQLIHIGGSSKVICDLYLKDVPPPQERPDMNVSEMSKEEVKSFVKSQMQAVADSMATMSNQQLAEMIKSFGGNDMTRLEGLLTVHDHMTNHKAKANLYVRMSGNTPPSYRYY